MSKFVPETWIQSAMTPCRVDTPDGAISISWRGNMDNGERERLAEDAARLIARAPSMLETLQWLDGIGGLGASVHERIRDEIAKAVQP